MKILPVGTPVFSSYKSFAHYLSIMGNKKQSTLWVINHFLQLYTKYDKKDNVHFLDFNIGVYNLHFHPNNPWLNIESIETLRILRLMKLKDLIIDCLEDNRYIYMNCDPFYFPHSYSYQTNHRSSQILIFGYDLEKQIFHFADYSYRTNNKYEKFSLPMSTIVEAATNNKLDETQRIRMIKLMDLDYSFDFDLAGQLLKDHLHSNNTHRFHAATQGIYASTREHAVYGMDIYNELDDFLLHMKEEPASLNMVLPFSILWEHKLGLDLLIKYLIEIGRITADTDQLLQCSTQLCDKTFAVRNALVKLSISNNYSKLSSIRESLQMVRALEQQLIEKLIPHLSRPA
jgi:hypothetical protein